MKEILLVEDSDADAEPVPRILKTVGVVNPVRRLLNGVEAMAHLNHAEKMSAIMPSIPSVLLVDLKLPGISGFEILQRIQHRPAFSKMLRVVLSHLADTHSIKRAYGLGAQSFLTKPLNELDLAELIASFPGYWSLMARPAKVAPQIPH